MATRVGIVIAEFIAKTGKFVQGTKHVNRSLKTSGKAIKKTKKLLGTLFVAGASAVGYIAQFNKATLASNRYAESLNIPIQQLTAMEQAFQSVGIDQEKTGNILKDTAEKIADAYINMGGEAKEALDNLGLSAKQINQLNPGDQLLAIAEALDNIEDQGSKIQIMEALANDASLLLPLLDDNAKLLNELTERAYEIGSVKSLEDVFQAKEAAKNLVEFNANLDAIGSTFVRTVVPAINYGINAIKEAIKEFFSGEEVPLKWNFVHGEARNKRDSSSFLSAAQRKVYSDELIRINAELKELNDLWGGLAEKFRQVPEGTREYDNVVRDLSDISEQIRNLEERRREIKKLGVSSDDTSLFDLLKTRIDLTSEAADKLIARQEDLASGVKGLVAAYLPAEEAQTRYHEGMTVLNEAMRTGTDELRAYLTENNRLRKIVEALTDELDKSKSGEEDLSYAAQAAGYSFSSAFGDAIIKGEELSDVLASLADDLARLVFHETAGKFVSKFVSKVVDTVFAAKGAVVNAAIPPGVYSSPTFAPTSSPGVRALASGGVLFGEAGTEAVIPLPNGRSVPVEISGGRGDININNYTSGQVSVSEDDSGALQIDILEAALSQRLANGGSVLARTMEGTYRGLRR